MAGGVWCGGGASQDSNSLSLLTEMSGVEALVPRGPVPELQSLARGLLAPPCGEEERRRSWEEHSGELPEGWRLGSCWSLEEGAGVRGR